MERNIDVSFANLDDQEMVEPLIDEAKDGAYGSAKIQKRMSDIITSVVKETK